MATTNLEALNVVLEKVSGGAYRAKSNLEALNILCVLGGGVGNHKTNLDALNEFANIYNPGSPAQAKAVTITENGDVDITPDAGYLLSLVQVHTDVPSLPEQEKTVTITDNGTVDITPDDGYTLSKATAVVQVSGGESDYNVRAENLGQGKGLSALITKVSLNGVTGRDLSTAFANITGLKEVVWGNFPTTGNVTLTEMFQGCTGLTAIDLSQFRWTVSNMSSMFDGCTRLTAITGLEGLDISSLNTLYGVFYNCQELAVIDISGWNTGNVSDFGGLFNNCRKLASIVGLEDLNTTSLTNLSSTFYNCAALSQLDISSWDVGKVTSAQYMAYGCTGLTGFVTGAKNFDALTTAQYMFFGCKNLSNIDVSQWSMPLCTGFQYMFNSCNEITDIDTSMWAASPQYINNMFAGCTKLCTLNLTGFNTAKLASASSAWAQCSKLTDLTVSADFGANTSLTTLDFSYSPLSHDSAVNLFNNLATRTNTPTLKLSSTTKGYLSDDELAIATGKGWVIA